MSLYPLFSIARQGLDLASLRIGQVANNIAHQYTLSKDGEKVFQPQEVVARAYTPSITEVRVVPKHTPANNVYQPSHPLADKEGYLHYPGVNMVEEMTTLLQASQDFAANLSLFRQGYQLYLQALSLGESS